MAGETTSSTPNFYVLLGLNPDDSWDDKKFEQVIAEKRSEWSRKSSSFGAVALEAKKNLALINEIQRVMADPAARAAQMASAKKILAADRTAKIADFERQLAIAEGQGFLEKNVLDKLLAAFKGVLSEQEMRSRVKVSIRDESLQGSKENQQLDQSLIKDISAKLQIVGKSDLYDLLGRPKTTSSQELCNAAVALYDAMQHRQPKTPEVTATSDLAGKAKTIFKTDDMRRKYDESLRLSSLNAILEEFERTVNIGGKDKQKGLYEGQVSLFLEQAARAGWSAEEAFNQLSAFANTRHWFLRVATMAMNTQRQRCGYCNELNEKGRDFCRKCNHELSIACPDCGQRVRSDEVGCGKCGFPVGNRFWVDEVLGECQYLLSQQDLVRADAQLKLAEGAWTPKKTDSRLQRIQQCRTQISQELQEKQKSVGQFKRYMDERQLFAAQAYISQQNFTAIADREAYLRTITTEISQARELLKRAQAYSSSTDQKIEMCVQALRICTDFKEARDLLSTMPPSAPKNLQAKIGGATVSLLWNPSPTRGVSYTIVRKTHSQPISAKDGQVLETVTGYIYDDTHPEIGVPTFYAVFATLEGVVSVDAATLQRPVMLIRDVSDLSVRVDDQLVSLSWQAPPNMQNVIVVRNEKTPPRSISDGMQLPTLDSTQLVDRTVNNDVQYFYAVYAQFKDYNGQIVNAPGVTVKTTPETPPTPIGSLEVTSAKALQGYEVKLHWPVPSKGQAAILRSDRQPRLKFGEVIDRKQLMQYGGRLLQEERPGSLTDRWAQPGIAWYTPLVIFQGTAFVGEPKRVDVLDDISDLKYRNLGSSLQLNWTWPTNCKEVVVAYSYDTWPQPDSATANIQKVTRAEYDYLGHYIIRGSMNHDLFIVVAAIIRQGSVQIIGAGVRVQARLASKIVVSYEIKTTRNLFGPKKRLLHVSARIPGTLPTLLLVSKVGRLPLRKEEGEPLRRIEGPTPIEKDLEFELPDRAFAPKTFGKLYLEDDGLYDRVTIHHPSEDKLRLS